MTEKYKVGALVSGGRIHAGLVGPRAKIIARKDAPLNGDPAQAIKATVKSLFGSAGPIVGVGLGLPGLVSGLTVIRATNTPGLNGMVFKDFWDSIPVGIENNAKAMAIGEMRYGALKGMKDFIFLSLGDGIGGAIVKNGSLMDMPTEIGHMSIEQNGRPCFCGNAGCLESYASGRAITEQAAKALESGAQSSLRECCKGNIYRITSQDVYTAAMEGDATAREVLKNSGKALGSALSSLVNIFGLTSIAISGHLQFMQEIYLKEAFAEARKRAIKDLGEKIEPVGSKLGIEAGILGAALLAPGA